MDIFDLKVKKRAVGKSSVAKRMRKQGIIPAVVYAHGDEALALEVTKKDLYHLLHSHADENILVNLAIDGEKSRTALLSEIQTHPVNDEILHVDFKGVSMDQKIIIKVAIHEKGESVGVKEGGILDHAHREIEIECLPTQIPESIIVDISELAIGDSIHIKDLSLPEGIVCLDDPETTLLSVLVPKVEEEVAPSEGEEEESAEPEVIKKGKEESDSEEEEK